MISTNSALTAIGFAFICILFPFPVAATAPANSASSKGLFAVGFSFRIR